MEEGRKKMGGVRGWHTLFTRRVQVDGLEEVVHSPVQVDSGIALYMARMDGGLAPLPTATC